MVAVDPRGMTTGPSEPFTLTSTVAFEGWVVEVGAVMVTGLNETGKESGVMGLRLTPPRKKVAI